MNRRVGTIYLLRHAEAAGAKGPGAAADRRRPLTGPGRETARAVGRWLRERGVGIEVCISSPLVRALETAEIVAAAAGIATVTPDERVAPGALPPALLEAVRERNVESVLLCGHEPDLGFFLAHLLCPGAGAIPFKKGGLAAVKVDGEGNRLLFFLPPALM